MPLKDANSYSSYNYSYIPITIATSSVAIVTLSSMLWKQTT